MNNNIKFSDKDLLSEDIDLHKASFKKTVYLDGEVLDLLDKEAKRRGVKKSLPLINDILKEMLSQTQKESIDDRLTRIEQHLKI